MKQPLCPSDPSSPAAADVICMSREAAAAPPLPQATLNDRFSQHTKHCKICSQALQQLSKRLAAARAAAVGMAAAAAGLVGALVVVVLSGFGKQLLTQQSNAGLVWGSATGINAAAAAGMWGWCGVGFQLVAAAAVLLGAAAVAAAVLAGRLQQKQQEFMYVEFAHADND